MCGTYMLENGHVANVMDGVQTKYQDRRGEMRQDFRFVSFGNLKLKSR